MPAIRGKAIEVIRVQRGFPRRLPLGPEAIEEIRGSDGGDAAASRVAGAQFGVAARWQLRMVGLSDDAIDRRRGRTLHPLYHGVFLVGHVAAHPLSLPTAALLAAGPTATLGFHTAAWMWDYAAEPFGVIDVVHPGHRTSRKGLRFHVGEPAAPAWRDGLPLTSPARTAVDMATILSGRDADHLVDRALMTEHLTPDDLERAIVPHRRNAAVLREILEIGEDLAKARSQAEQRMFRLLKRGRLPKPEVNGIVAGCEFDFVWFKERLIVEYDSWRFHRTPRRFVNDRHKQALAHAAGFRVERMVRHDLYKEPDALLVRIAQALVQTWPSTAPGTPVLVE